MVQTKLINLATTSAWDSAEQIVRLSAELLPHVCKAIDAENASLRYAEYVHDNAQTSGINENDSRDDFWEQDGHYYADNIAKLERLRQLLSWLSENVI